MRERDVAGAAGRGGEADANEVGAHAIEIVGFDVEGDGIAGARFGDPCVERLHRRHRLIGVMIEGQMLDFDLLRGGNGLRGS